MTTAPRAFRRQVKAKKQDARPTIAFTLDWISDDETDDDGNPVLVRSDTFHATMPTDERLFLIAAMAGDEEQEGTGEAAAVIDLFRDALPAEEYRTLRQRIKDPDDDVDLEMLQDVLMWLMGEWSAFPTVPASASSGSRPTSGAKSTGRAPGRGSTRSTST